LLSPLDPSPQPAVKWLLVRSPFGSASWLCHFGDDGEVTGYAPPGVPLAEDEDEPTFGWRRALWPESSALTWGEEPFSVEPLRFVDVIDAVPEDRLAWALETMEAQMNRLRWFLLPRPGDGEQLPPGVEQAAYALRVLERDYALAQLNVADALGSGPGKSRLEKARDRARAAAAAQAVRWSRHRNR
jgi:hypothetical protein